MNICIHQIYVLIGIQGNVMQQQMSKWKEAMLCSNIWHERELNKQIENARKRDKLFKEIKWKKKLPY